MGGWEGLNPPGGPNSRAAQQHRAKGPIGRHNAGTTKWAGSAAPGAAFGTRTDTGSRHREPSLTAGTGPPAPLNQNQDCRPASLTARTWQRDHSSGTPRNQEQNRVQGSFALNQDRSTRPPSLTARTGVPGALRTRIRAPGPLTWNPGSSTRPPSQPGPRLKDPSLRTRTRAPGPQLWDPSEPGRGSRTPCIQPGLGHWDHSSGTTQNQGSSTRPPSLRTRTRATGPQLWDPSEPGWASMPPSCRTRTAVPGLCHSEPGF